MHPYKNLDKKHFWRSSVSQVNPLAMADVYRKKFEISKTDSISTAGSCFAQHIARKLSRSGFNFRDFEPAIEEFPAELREQFNYGVYSARYCNIYTARQLLQTFQRALGLFAPKEEFWTSLHGVYDPFRPMVEPTPFTCLEEAVAARQSHYESLRRLLKETDLFIFTFGLTEAWEDSRDGSVLPVCPGTQAGEFNPEIHRFVNFTAAETLADFKAFVALCREVNPAMRFIVTVSPVPLVATASKEHVLVATTYSKSVLRAVAGQLADEDDGIAYFPSYELVSSPPFRASFFEPDMRGVTPWGVDYVMSHFFRAHLPAGEAETPTGPAARTAIPKSETDVVCEEMLLEMYAS